MSEKEDLGLIEGEKVLIQTKAIEDRKTLLSIRKLLIGFGIAGIVLLIIGFYYLIPDEEYPRQYLGFYAFLYFSLLCFTAMIAGFLISYYNAKTTYYITSNRILRVRDRYFSFRNPKIYEISFKNFSHLIIYPNALKIIPRKKNGELYYKGDEIEPFYKPWILKVILIRLNGYKGKKLITKAVDILTREVPLSQHPNMDFLFIKSI